MSLLPLGPWHHLLLLGALCTPAAHAVAGDLLSRDAIPQLGAGPPSERDCEQLAGHWAAFQRRVVEQHKACLDGHGGGRNSRPGVACSFAACEQLHVLMHSTSSGEVATYRYAQEEYCATRSQHAERVREQALAGFTDRSRPDYVGELRAIRLSRKRRDERHNRRVGATTAYETSSGAASPEAQQWQRRARRDLDAYHQAERRRRAGASRRQYEQLNKDIQRFIKRRPRLPLGLLEAGKTLFDSTMDNPDYVRTIDAHPHAARAIKRLVDLEQSLRPDGERYWRALLRQREPGLQRSIRAWEAGQGQNPTLREAD